MTRAASACPLGPEFDPFLFAPIGADRNGMPVSVLSVLARMDVDPWREAARLTALPEAAATQALAALLAARAENASADAGTGTTAARLIALLPRQTGSSASPRRTLPRTEATTGSRASLPAILFLILMALMLGAEALTARHQPPAPGAHVQRGHVQAAGPTTASPAPQSRTAGQ